MAKPKQNRLAAWYGSDAMIADRIGPLFNGCSWVGVPFGGGMSAIQFIKATAVVVGDLHRHIINMATVIAENIEWLASAADAKLFHPDALSDSQKYCIQIESLTVEELARLSKRDREQWALAYFICCWMGRSAKAGTDGEFSGNLPVRWSATGGDSNVRYRSMVESLQAWHLIAKGCNFVCCDFREFLVAVKDDPKHGLYVDGPWPEDGDKYTHNLNRPEDGTNPRVGQIDLRDRLAAFEHVRLVIRFNDHPLIRELYPESEWEWRRAVSRDQANKECAEVLICRRVA